MVLFESAWRFRHGVTASTSTVGVCEYTVICDYDIRPNFLDFCLAHLLRLAKNMVENMAGDYCRVFRYGVGI